MERLIFTCLVPCPDGQRDTYIVSYKWCYKPCAGMHGWQAGCGGAPAGRRKAALRLVQGQMWLICLSLSREHNYYLPLKSGCLQLGREHEQRRRRRRELGRRLAVPQVRQLRAGGDPTPDHPHPSPLPGSSSCCSSYLSMLLAAKQNLAHVLAT